MTTGEDKKATRYFPIGDSAVVVEFGNTITPQVHALVQKMAFAVGLSMINGLVEVVPAYRSLTVYYDALLTDYETLVAQLRLAEERSETIPLPPSRRIKIPVSYGGQHGPDIESVAKYNNLSVEELIQLHSSQQYLVYMLGFTPGFPYMGSLQRKILAPRKESPSAKVPAGSLGLAGEQTGIYPFESPGGWQIIGWTSMKMFDLGLDPPATLAPGDIVEFEVAGH
ncbi:MAG: 5-oxoprolinase subunit PxpB [Planctomycetota bacterium]|nr:5-oxoprolinase subunit PxpB [Planctomycetota bacterium]